MSDPAQQSGARDSSGHKQLLFEPFFGGGLVTALSIPVIARAGLMASVTATMLLLTVTVTVGIRSGRTHQSR